MNISLDSIEKLYLEGKSASQIAFYLNAKICEVQKLIQKNNFRPGKIQPNIKTFSDIISYKDEHKAIWQRERNFIEKALSKYFEFTVINDLHTPYQNNDLLDTLVNEDKNKLLFIIGDFFHLDGASTFKKHRFIPFDTELQSVLDILTLLSKKYEKIVFLMANHERRFMRLLYDKMNSEYADVLKEQAKLSKRLSNIFDGNILETDCFWLRMGGVIMCHPDWYTKAPTKTVQNSHEYFVSLGIDDYDCILNAHTHKCTKAMKLNKVMVEMPCACVPQEYMNDGHRYNSEYYQGWTTVKLDKNRRTDFNNVNVHFFNDR